MPRLENLEREKINKFLILLKNSNEVKNFFIDYKEVVLNSECQYINFFYDLDEFLKYKERIRKQSIVETVANNKKIKKINSIFFKKEKINNNLFSIENLEKKSKYVGRNK